MVSDRAHLKRARVGDGLGRLRDEIASGRIQAGERLPKEQQLALTYGVSRPIVREAVGRLKHDGLGVTRPGAIPSSR